MPTTKSADTEETAVKTWNNRSETGKSESISVNKDCQLLVRSLVALLDEYGFPDDQPANYRNSKSIGNKNLRGWVMESRTAIARAEKGSL